MKEISIIGAGIMGSGIAYQLLEKDHRVNLILRNPDKIANSKEPIAKYINSNRMKIYNKIDNFVNNSDLIVFCLTTDDVVESYFQELMKFSPKLILDTGTTSPSLTTRMYSSCYERHIQFADCPMTGSKVAARDGQILFLLGGDSSLRDSLDYFFNACSKNVILCGSIGSGQKAKIALNLTQAGLLQIYMEGFLLAKEEGISYITFMDIIQQSAANSPLVGFKMGQIEQSDFSTHFSLKNMNKDVNLAMNLTKDNHAVLPLSTLLKSIYEAGMRMDLGEEDFCSLVKVLNHWNNK